MRGIIYVMSFNERNMVEIGASPADTFKRSLNTLDHCDFCRSIRRRCLLAVSVEDYTEKIKLIQGLLKPYRILNSPFFEIDSDQVVALIKALDGYVVYPSKGGVRETPQSRPTPVSTEKVEPLTIVSPPKPVAVSKPVKPVEPSKPVAEAKKQGPAYEGITFYMTRKVAGFGQVKGRMVPQNGKFVLLKGSTVSLARNADRPIPNGISIKDNVLQSDVSFNSPSAASSFLTGNTASGWTTWRDDKGMPLRYYKGK